MSNDASRLFDAAALGDVETVRACLKAGADLAATNKYGFTALHRAAMGTNQADTDAILEVMKLLVDAGAPLEAMSVDGRSALYLAAEFSCSAQPVQYLLDVGANPRLTNGHGVCIVQNAMLAEVKQLLSAVTGIAIPPPPQPVPQPVKLSAAQWRLVKPRIDQAFATLSAHGVVALQDAGQTQEDGFADCSELYHDREARGVHGFCFYTRQDLNRAKRTSHLSLAFWGAPEGGHEDMKRVGQQVVDVFRDVGFEVDWDGSPSVRPDVHLVQA